MRNYENHSRDVSGRQGFSYMADKFSAVDLLNHIFSDVPAGVYVELTYILPPALAGMGPSPVSESYKLGADRLDWDRIATMNDKGYGVYYGLCAKQRPTPKGRRSSERDAAWCSCLWVDVDLQDGIFTSLDAIHDHLAFMRPVPTAIVSSGGGLHGLWKIAPVKVTPDSLPRLKQTLRGLALAARGDTSVAELARVFRLPDTVNTKPQRDGALCEVWDVWPPAGYTLASFAHHYTVARPETRPLDRTFTPHCPDDLPAYVRWYVDQPHQQGQRNDSLNWTAYKMHSDGYSQQDAERLLVPRALADGLDENEALRTIHSAFTADRGAPSYISKAQRIRMAAGDVARRVLGGVS